MRVSQGGHDVPTDKLFTRYPRTLANLQAAMRVLPHVLIFDNEDLKTPFRHVADFESGQMTFHRAPLPRLLSELLK